MKSPRILLSILTGAALVLWETGCSILEPKADNTRFYVLRPNTPASAAPTASRANNKGPAIRIGPGSIAGYLDVTPIVVTDGPNRLRRLDLHHWAEPLSKGIGRSLGETLSRELEGATVILYPEPPPAEGSLEIRYLVNHFEGTLDGPLILAVTWQLIALPSGTTIAHGDQVYTMPTKGHSHDVPGYAERMSQALEDWAKDLASAIREQSPTKP